MKNKFKSIFKILIVVTGCLMFASFSPSLDGRAVVVENGEYPQGLFAKTVGYLPGDIISVTNIAGDKTVDILVIGAIDPSEGVAIMLSPEAAEAIGIDKSSNNIVKLTKRSGQDERVYGNAVISKSSASSELYDETLDSIGEVENTEAFEEPEAEETEAAENEETEVEASEPEVEEAESETEAEIEEEAEAVEPVEEENSEEAEIEETEETAPIEDVPEEVEEEAFEEEAAEAVEEETFEEEEDLSEAFEDEVPEMSEAEPAIEELEVEETEESDIAEEVEETPLEEAPLEEAEEETEENFDEEYADDQEFEEYPETPAEETFEEEEPAALEEEPAAEAFEEDKPEALAEELPSEEAFEEDALDELPAESEAETTETEEYEAIVLVPAESNPPEAIENEELEDLEEIGEVASTDNVEEVVASEAEVNDGEVVEAVDEAEEVGLVEEETAIILEPVSEVKTSKASGSYEKYLVPSLKNLESGKYYIQIAVYSSDENVNKVIDTYGNNYPITIVPMAGGVSKQVLIGPLSMDEYKVVLERFKSYGFKDAFLRKVK